MCMRVCVCFSALAFVCVCFSLCLYVCLCICFYICILDVRGYLPLYRDKALPFLHFFKPDLVIISAGYDTLNEDNLAQVSQHPGK